MYVYDDMKKFFVHSQPKSKKKIYSISDIYFGVRATIFSLKHSHYHLKRQKLKKNENCVELSHKTMQIF